MKYFVSILVSAVFIACAPKGDRSEILTAAVSSSRGLGNKDYTFKLYSDSTYTFDIHEYEEYAHEKNEVFRGRNYFRGDSIIFFPSLFQFTHSEIAVIKNGYIEFINGDRPFKMKVIDAFADYEGVDTVKFNDYSMFTYDTAFYNDFPKSAIPYDLTNVDLIEVDRLLSSCLANSNLSFPLSDYFKQCMAVKNSSNEREVWVNLLCHYQEVAELDYFLIQKDDGGDCYLNVKLNLDKSECYDLSINGEA